jgi:hypothetical protein
MPFGLKNAGATYQRMMQNCLGSQIRCNIQVYIDDVVITTRKEESLISDLTETFDNLNRYKLKLNPTNVLSAYQQDNSWGSWNRQEEYKQTQKRSKRS